MGEYNDAKKASNKRYMDKLQRLYVWCTPEEKGRITEAAAESGQSVNAYIKQAIEMRMEKG